MGEEIIQKEFLGERNRSSTSSFLIGRKPRVFQTFMTDKELAKRNIAVTPPVSNDEIGRWFLKDGSEISHNLPILHDLNWMKSSQLGFSNINQNIGTLKRSHILKGIEDRINQLRAIANEEEVRISEESIKRAVRFLNSLRFGAVPGVFLSGNGNLRIVWSNESGEQAAFQVKSQKDEVQYVIFRLNDECEIEQILGSMSFKNVYPFVRSLGLIEIFF